MVITEARPISRGRIGVWVDGEYVGAVEPLVWADSGLTLGQETDAQALTTLLREAAYSQAKRRALNMLSARSYSTAQLTERIAQKTDRVSAERAVARMEELGYLNDAAYAARLAERLWEEKGFALRRIRHELTQQGLSRDDIDDAVSWIDPDEEPQRAVELALARFAGSADEKACRRAAAWLERSGYGRRAVFYALRALRTGEAPE
ncbi:MAG: regulatory protein RecX [Oscillospiraceae bacterium]